MAETGRFYSSIRRIPTTLHRLPDGTRLWGGPYTLVQGAGAAAVLALLWSFRGVWGTQTLIVDVVISLGWAAAAVWALRYAPDNIHELIMLFTGAINAWSKPKNGQYEGVKFELTRPPRQPQDDTSENAPTAAAPPSQGATPDETPQRPTYRPLGTSSVTRLLHQATAPTDRKDHA